MSTVVVHVGQCGNQLGQEYWKLVLKNATSTCSSHVWQHRDGKLRSIFVDSEPKVIAKTGTVIKKSIIREENVIAGRRGRGCNWALGYHGNPSDDKNDDLAVKTMEVLRKEVERCDSFSGIILMHSLSGGTGSGLGSRLCELIRDEYAMHYLLSCVVAPYTTGESPLQHYNSLLCLAWLQRFCDGVLFFHNDDVQRQASTKSGKSLQDMNGHIANCLCGIVLPTDSITLTSLSIGAEPWEMIRSVCPTPATKFIYTNHTNKSKMTWDALSTDLLQRHRKYNAKDERFSSIANLVVARGDATGNFPAYKTKMANRVKAAFNCVAWNPFPVDFWSAKHNGFMGARDSSSLTVASNYNSVTETCKSILERAKNMYDAGAYLHWYWKHGCEQIDFEEAFDTVQSIVTNYNEQTS